MNWRNVLEVEQSATKRRWLAAFSKPSVLGKDVGELGEDMIVNMITNELVELPLDTFIYTFGYSCKDLSLLNNFSREFADDCLAQGDGTSGQTWKGNMRYVRRAHPPLVFIENVKQALKNKNLDTMRRDLEAEGYILVDLVLNARDAAFPQDRVRAWFCAVLKQFASPEWRPKFMKVVASVKCADSDVMPMSKFVFPPGHSYVTEVLACKRHAAAKRKQRRAVPMQRSKTKRAKPKWIVDHWRARRFLNLPAAPKDYRPNIKHAADACGMCDRERDLLSIVEAGCHLSSAATEIKHSAPRVVLQAGAKKQISRGTSCLLPASKIVLWPPVVDKARLLTGLEALSLQGVPPEHHEGTGRVIGDADYMSLAGNAFNGGCFSIMMLAALATVDLSELDW